MKAVVSLGRETNGAWLARSVLVRALIRAAWKGEGWRVANDGSNRMPIMEFSGFRLDTINLCVWRRGNVGGGRAHCVDPQGIRRAFDTWWSTRAGW